MKEELGKAPPPGKIPQSHDTDSRWLSRNIVCLFVARALRSVALGYISIILPIYLAELGYSAVYLGVLFSISAFVSAVVAALTGVLADRFGRKPFIVVIPLMMTVGALVFAMSRNFTVMVVAAAFGTFGFPGGAGMGGGWGPYYPAAQSLIAENIADMQRTSVFGVLSFVGVIAGALGSLLAAVPGILNRAAGVSMLAGYRTLFVFAALLSTAMAVVVVPVNETHRWEAAKAAECESGKSDDAPPPTIGERKRLGLSRASWRLVLLFMSTNAVNGLAIGMLGPFVVYWFYRRFGATASELAQVFFIINLIAAAPYLLAGRLTRWLGTVITVAVTRTLNAVMLLCVIAMPTFRLAALFFALRMVMATLSIPVRQSYLMGVIEPSERASAAGLSSLPSQATQALSAYFAGFLMQHVALSLPLALAALLQGAYGGLYYFFFRNVRPPEEELRHIN